MTEEVKPDPCAECGRTDGHHSPTDDDCLFLDKKHRRHVKADTGHLCRWCVDRLDGYLTEILDLYATLAFVAEPGSVPDDTAQHRHTKSDSAPAPLRLDVLTLLDDRNHCTPEGLLTSDVPDVAGVLDVLARNVCEDRGLAGTSLDGSVMTSIRLLKAHLEWIAGSPSVDEFAAEIEWVRAHLRRVHGLADPKPIGKCMVVDCEGVVWPGRDGGNPKCSRCRRTYDGPSLLRLRVNEGAA